MKTENGLHKQLNKPQVPDELRQKIVSNWESQQANVSSQKWHRSRPFLAVAASVLIVIFTFVSFENTPHVIYSALNDIEDDIKHDGGISIDIKNIMAEYQINLPPASMVVKMTKYCSLDKHRTLHLQIARAEGTEKGEMHLFLNKGVMTSSFWQMNEGETKNMPWKIIQPRSDLSVLIFSSVDMDAGQVESVSQRMFL